MFSVAARVSLLATGAWFIPSTITVAVALAILLKFTSIIDLEGKNPFRCARTRSRVVVLNQ